MSINLAANIKPELWSAIASNYESGHYKDAILEAMHFLTEVLRSKTGLDNDGDNLAGAALGGNAPLLRINKLETETEKNIQNGTLYLVKGLYTAIRNPRSHGQMQDKKEDADAIICFIDYILKVLDASEEAFTVDGFMDRIYDPDFVESEEYAKLLFLEVPKNKRLDTAIELYRRKYLIDDRKLELLMCEVFKELSETQINQFLAVVSDELKWITDFDGVRKNLRILRPDLWKRLSEIARLRIENKLLKAIEEGKCDTNGNVSTHFGALGTWARRYLVYFTLKDEVAALLLKKLRSDDFTEQQYVSRYFKGILARIITESWAISSCVSAICKLIEAGDIPLKEYVRYENFPEEWQTKFEAKLGKDFFPSNVDDIPF